MPGTKRVLLVDDDAMLRESLAEQLEQEDGFGPVQAGTCAEGRRLAREGLYEFMILDVGLPDGDGRALCREFRDSGVTAPIILLTAADTDADTIEGLKSGANDYVTKPFRFAVLMARVHAHLRSHGQSEEAVYRIGPYTFRPSAKLLVD
ncbi:MAG: response regulator transcription factor, partial [Rhizomicrobium sp.]